MSYSCINIKIRIPEYINPDTGAYKIPVRKVPIGKDVPSTNVIPTQEIDPSKQYPTDKIKGNIHIIANSDKKTPYGEKPKGEDKDDKDRGGKKQVPPQTSYKQGYKDPYKCGWKNIKWWEDSKTGERNDWKATYIFPGVNEFEESSARVLSLNGKGLVKRLWN